MKQCLWRQCYSHQQEGLAYITIGCVLGIPADSSEVWYFGPSPAGCGYFSGEVVRLR